MKCDTPVAAHLGSKRKIKIVVYLPVPYRGGTLRAAKQVAIMLYLGSRAAKVPCDVVFSCCQDVYAPQDMEELTCLNIEVRPTVWKVVGKETLSRYYALRGDRPVPSPQEEDYVFPTDGCSNFSDCTHALLISDRTCHTFAPLIPYGIIIYDYIQRYERQIFTPENNLMEPAFLRNAKQAAFVMTTTPHTRNDAIQYGGCDEAKTLHFPMTFTPPKRSLLRSSPHPKPYLLWVTNPAFHKNALVAVQALLFFYTQYLGDLDTLIIGPSTHWLTPAMKQHHDPRLAHVSELLHTKPILKEKCHVLGEIDENVYSSFVQYADFVWNPTMIDNGTFSVVEAAYLQVPSLSSDYPAMRYMDERFSLNLLFANSHDPHEMASKLKEMEQTSWQRKLSLPASASLEGFTPDQVALPFWNQIISHFIDTTSVTQKISHL